VWEQLTEINFDINTIFIQLYVKEMATFLGVSGK